MTCQSSHPAAATGKAPSPRRTKIHLRPRVIGLVGRKRCGKSTTAHRLVAELRRADAQVMVLPYADYLREHAETLLDQLGVDANEVHRALWVDKEDVIVIPGAYPPLTGRRLLQGIGDGLRAACGFSPFVAAWCLEADRWLADFPGGVLLVDDVRFPEEVEAIRARGGVIFRVEGGDDSDSHTSETALAAAHFDRLTPDFDDADFAWLNPVRKALGLA